MASALLGALALVLDHGLALGLPRGALELTGRLYFAGLVLAPLVLYPVALGQGAPLGERLALSLLPGFLWWATEVGASLARHTPAEAIWLALSPFHLAHLALLLMAAGAAHLGARCAGWARGGPRPRFGARAMAGALALIVVPSAVVGGSIGPFLLGYRALFQADRLPMPATRPGSLDPATVVRRPGAPARPPNVVFILSDDHRWDYAGYEGHPFVETPSLDRLAAEGVRFDRAFVTSSLCSPSRASFLTGTYPHRHGVWNNFTPWSDDNQTFLEFLGAAGYRTAFVGKWHMPGGLPDLRGVDHFVTFTTLGGQGVYEWCPLVVDGREEPSRKRYVTEELTDRALAWLDAGGDEPFALVLSHKSVHADFAPDTPERGRYADQPVALPPGAHPWIHTTGGQYVHLSFTPLDDLVRRYAEAVASMDRQIGRVLDWLDANGRAEDTLVVYTSDNGYLWGEHGLVDKRWPFEPSMRVPFLVRYPASGHAGGERRDALLLNVDLAPTLLALAGLEAPAWMQGRSFLPLLRDGRAPWRDALLYAYFYEPPYPVPTSRAVRTGRYKWIEYGDRPPALYDLELDPEERRDRSRDPGLAGVRAELEARLAALAAEVAGPTAGPDAGRPDGATP